MKVKIFTNHYESLLCKDINTFIYSKEIVDIKYSITVSNVQGYFYTAMVIFK